MLMAPPRASLGRDRNKVKFSTWGVYLRVDAAKSLDKMRKAAKSQKARVPGQPNQPLKLTKVSKAKVEIAWPLPVVADNCVRFLKRGLGDDWRKFVTDPAGVQGTAAATARDEAEDSDGTLSPEEADGLAAASSAVDRVPASAEETLVAFSSVAPRAATANLLALKLETIIHVYADKPGRYENVQQAYCVNWQAELGKGTYGKVYVGTLLPATGLHRDKDAWQDYTCKRQGFFCHQIAAGPNGR